MSDQLAAILAFCPEYFPFIARGDFPTPSRYRCLWSSVTPAGPTVLITIHCTIVSPRTVRVTPNPVSHSPAAPAVELPLHSASADFSCSHSTCLRARNLVNPASTIASPPGSANSSSTRTPTRARSSSLIGEARLSRAFSRVSLWAKETGGGAPTTQSLQRSRPSWTVSRNLFPRVPPP